ncbi:MAG TPA: kynureninase [Streptosporangiaceae bacterium]|jgi:kynureninase|nr:kynureninase [Streptosporangiaceae bacterium]
MSEVMLERGYAEKLDAADPLAEYRERFLLEDPGLIYLNGNSLGALPRATLARMETVFREEWGTALARSWDHWVDLPARAGDVVGELIGAAAGQVIVTDNTTVNLYKLATAALDARPGRHVIITDHDNFPSDRYVMAGLAAQRGAELRMLATDINEGVHPDLVRAAVDEDTALVSLSHVAYRSGALADMAAITAIVHQAGALMLWDLCHSVGAVPVDLDGCEADLAVGCTYKYLNAGPGAPAFAYVSARLREVLRQPIWGWFSQRDQFGMGPSYDPAPGMAKFMTGTPSIPGTAAVEEGARLLLEAGPEPMRDKSMRLTAYLIELADAWLVPLGCAVATPREASRRGGHVSFCHPQAERIVEQLASDGVIADYRTPDRFRFGLSPLTTRFTDVWDAADAARALIAELFSSGASRG